MSNSNLSKLQPTKPSGQAMVASPAAVGGGVTTTPLPLVQAEQKQSLGSQAKAGYASNADAAKNSQTCKKRIQVGIFFDGTGNNHDADLPTLEHSNVVRVYRAHRENPVEGIYRIYVPGIGTLFPEIGDGGGGLFGPAMGAQGQDRLDWAFKELQRVITKVEPTCKEIVMISLSVFGFSRGAALARAFLRDLVDPKKPYGKVQGKSIHWRRGNHPLEIQFVGIWDTVASVGVVMSANNAMALRSNRRTYTNAARFAVREISKGLIGADLSAQRLAFAPQGVDPSPGVADGHNDWANGMEIPGDLLKRCVHIIAAHEQRNSFPVDSVSRGSTIPANTEEMVFPGVHSNVGGGYRPGEQGKGAAAHAGEENLQGTALQLSQISLRVMYDRALAAGVPLRPMSGPEWAKQNKDDFALSPVMLELFNHYTSYVRAQGLPLGDAMLAHMRALFAWRFQHIRAGARKQDNAAITENEKLWKDDAHTLQARKDALTGKRMLLQRKQMGAVDTKKNPTLSSRPELNTPEWNQLNAEIQAINQELKEIQAKEDTLPSRDTLVKNLAEYDAELLEDAISIHKEVSGHPEKRAQLRPHYRNLLQAYEDEYRNGKGLRDEKVIAFFDNHVHDSMADFDKDSTLPSDPRVVYIGGDVKMFYASLDKSKDVSTEPAATAQT